MRPFSGIAPRIGMLFAVSYLLCAGPIESQGPPLNLLRDKTVVDFGDYIVDARHRNRLLLSVDRDDRLETYLLKMEGGKATLEPLIERVLGRRIWYSGRVPLAGLLPAGVVPTMSFQVSPNSKHRFHVILAWGLDKKQDLIRAAYNIYVFSENEETRSLRKTYEELAIDEELITFLVEDVNNDGRAEIVDIGLGGKIELATVRILGANGVAKEIQSFAAREVIFVRNPAKRLGTFLLRDKADSQECPVNGICYVQKEMNWSKDRKQFIERRP